MQFEDIIDKIEMLVPELIVRSQGPGPNERPINWPFSTLVGERPQPTVIYFWGERPPTLGVNGHGLLGERPAGGTAGPKMTSSKVRIQFISG